MTVDSPGFRRLALGDLTEESTVRLLDGDDEVYPVYGVDRSLGLTSEAKYASENLSRYKLLRPGMFAYNPMRLNIGSIGYCSRRHRLGLVSPDYVVFECKEDRLLPDYLAYAIKGDEWTRWTQSAGVGSVRVRIYYRELARLELAIPCVAEQRVIADILGLLDDRIALGRRTNETLEAMARAIFKSWFVDFDPVHAKSEGRKPDGMDAETAKLFPSSFVDSEIGRVPKGWEVQPLDATANFLNGLACQKYPPTGDNSLPVIKIADLRNGVSDTTDRASPAVGEDYIVKNGDVLFSWSGSLLVKIWTGGKGVLNQHLFKVTSDHFPRWFYYFWVKEHLLTFQSIAQDKATTMGHIKRHHLTDAKVVVPDSAIIKKADEIIAPLVERFLEGDEESAVLSEARNVLLPRLLSGELAVEAMKAMA